MDHPAEDIKELMSRGEYLAAYDRAAERIETGGVDAESGFLAVLALARSGSTEQARRRYSEYGLGTIPRHTLPESLADDIEVLAARLDKNEALARLGDPTEWARRSAEGYRVAFDRSRLAYHATNAATMSLLAGEEEQAAALARVALEEGVEQGHAYWDAATSAEAALIVGDLERAGDAIASARAHGEGLFSERATTLKQLRLVCGLVGADPGILAPLENPCVVHYCGHRILPEGERGRFPATEEGRVREELDSSLEQLGSGFGYGSLAAGADILAAEALLDRGARLYVVLPFPVEEFVQASVRPAGDHWVPRFERCLAGATTVELATTSEYLGDPILFDFCSRIAMGDALIRAGRLEAHAHQVAVWDGLPADAAAGTARDVALWQKTGAASTVISVKPGESAGSVEPTGDARAIRAIIFADYAGFSGLTDGKIKLFQDEVLAKTGEALEAYRPNLLSSRTWGDGISLVFDDVAAAAECALDLVAVNGRADMKAAGLPELRGIRIAAHAAPLFEGVDPVSGKEQFFGVGMTQAARIEPRTPEGEIYTTHAFAALAVLENSDGFATQYVGNIPTAKGFGNMPLYALRRAVST